MQLSVHWSVWRHSSSPQSASARHIWILPIWLDLQVILQIFSGFQIWALKLLKDFHIPVVKPLQRRLGSRFESCWRRNVLAPLSGLWHWETCSPRDLPGFESLHYSSGPLAKSPHPPWPNLKLRRRASRYGWCERVDKLCTVPAKTTRFLNITSSI